MSEIDLTPPGGGGMCITDLAMAPADIIVSTTSSPVAELIRVDTGSKISHAALYDGMGGVYEAIGTGVTHRSLITALADDTLAVAYRVLRMNPTAAQKILAFAKSVVGKGYDTFGAAGGGMRSNPMVCVMAFGIIPCVIGAMGGFKSQDKFYCSQLVLEAYRRAGMSFIDINPNTSV